MRLELRHAFLASCGDGSASPPGRSDAPLPPEIAFLVNYGIHRARLEASARAAQRDGTCPARTLIADGGLNESFYYQALAQHLGLEFSAGWPEIAPLADPAAAMRAGGLRLASTCHARWMIAPEGGALRRLLDGEGRPLAGSGFIVTTPAHLAALIAYRAQAAIERAATDALPDQAPWLSARGAFGTRIKAIIVMALAATALALAFAPRATGDVLGVMFLTGMGFRMLVGLAGSAGTPPDRARAPADSDLPVYTVLVPLRQEAAMVPDIVEALAALDYPRAKLDVMLLVEPEDVVTRAALASVRLPPWLRVILGPSDEALRTKPRALNIGLALARGTLLTVYDAEDRPERDQLRRAAAAMADAPDTIGCLQARLSIDNGDGSLLARGIMERCSIIPLARLFALEYAALFDVLNVGIARLHLPFSLGGTSNHFRVDALREVGGWDAWNVTEDADLGLRLAQFGYTVECLASSTREAAPDRFAVWLKQRRRWTKGWMQIAVVLARDAPCLVRRFGPANSAATALLLVNLVGGPLLFPVFQAIIAYRLATSGFAMPQGLVETAEAVLAGTVMALGVVSTLWFGWAGLRARGLLRFLPALPLLLPYQLMISLAAWMGLADLLRRPYHWHKTVHRPADRDAPLDEFNRSWLAAPLPRRTGFPPAPRA